MPSASGSTSFWPASARPFARARSTRETVAIGAERSKMSRMTTKTASRNDDAAAGGKTDRGQEASAVDRFRGFQAACGSTLQARLGQAEMSIEELLDWQGSDPRRSTQDQRVGRAVAQRRAGGARRDRRGGRQVRSPDRRDRRNQMIRSPLPSPGLAADLRHRRRLAGARSAQRLGQGGGVEISWLARPWRPAVLPGARRRRGLRPAARSGRSDADGERSRGGGCACRTAPAQPAGRYLHRRARRAGC